MKTCNNNIDCLNYNCSYNHENSNNDLLEFNKNNRNNIIKLHTFINNSNIFITELLNISNFYRKKYKCNNCYNKYKKYTLLETIIKKIQKMKQINRKESINYLKTINKYNKKQEKEHKQLISLFKNNNKFPYYHLPTIININKLFILLKNKLSDTESHILYNNILTQFSEFYSCPLEMINNINLNSIFNYNIRPKNNKIIIENNKSEYNINDFNIILKNNTIPHNNINIYTSKCKKKKLNNPIKLQNKKPLIYNIIKYKPFIKILYDSLNSIQNYINIYNDKINVYNYINNLELYNNDINNDYIEKNIINLSLNFDYYNNKEDKNYNIELLNYYISEKDRLFKNSLQSYYKDYNLLIVNSNLYNEDQYINELEELHYYIEYSKEFVECIKEFNIYHEELNKINNNIINLSSIKKQIYSTYKHFQKIHYKS